MKGCNLINSIIYNETFKTAGEAVLRLIYNMLSNHYGGRKVLFTGGLGISASLCMNAFDMFQKEIDEMVYFKAEGQVQADGYFLLIPYDRKTHEAMNWSNGLTRNKYPEIDCSTNALTKMRGLESIRESTGPFVQFRISICVVMMAL